jgi:hypothetical protein
MPSNQLFGFLERWLRAVSQFDGLIFTIDDGPSMTLTAA